MSAPEGAREFSPVVFLKQSETESPKTALGVQLSLNLLLAIDNLGDE